MNNPKAIAIATKDQDPSQVDSALYRLKESIESLRSTISITQDNLSCVLRIEEKSSENIAPPLSNLVPLAERISDLDYEVRNILGILCKINNRLELPR